jgi:hypothetical protein
MTETIEGEQEQAMKMFKKTGQLPLAKEGISEIGRRAQTGELSGDNVGQNQIYHRMVTISKETPDNRFEEPQMPDVFTANPEAAEYYRIMAETEKLEKEAAKVEALRKEANENEAKEREKYLAWQAIAHKQSQLQSIDKKIHDRDSLIANIADLRTHMGEPSISEQQLLTLAANMPESSVVEYAKRTGDIDLLSQDPRISNETVLNVISFLADKEVNQQ